jgi:PAS domain-containing protein
MSVDTIGANIGRMERREWFLWTAAVVVTLLLTVGLTSFLLREDDTVSGLPQTVRGLIGLVLIFDIYTLFQQLQIHRMRRRLVRGEQLFRLISENAADMIAVVDMDGKRVFNSFSYEKVLGYSVEELQKSSSFEQIHPEDLEKVRQAAEEARRTGVGNLSNTACATRMEPGECWSPPQALFGIPTAIRKTWWS